MNHVSLVEVLTSSGTEYQVVREDGVILAFTYIKHYADVIFNPGKSLSVNSRLKLFWLITLVSVMFSWKNIFLRCGAYVRRFRAEGK